MRLREGGRGLVGLSSSAIKTTKIERESPGGYRKKSRIAARSISVQKVLHKKAVKRAGPKRYEGSTSRGNQCEAPKLAGPTSLDGMTGGPLDRSKS